MGRVVALADLFGRAVISPPRLVMRSRRGVLLIPVRQFASVANAREKARFRLVTAVAPANRPRPLLRLSRFGILIGRKRP